MSKYALRKLTSMLKEHIEGNTFLMLSKSKASAFTRLRKLSFCDIVYFMISAKRRCVQHELNEFMKQRGNNTVSRQAFAKSRENVRPEALFLLNEYAIRVFEKEDECKQTLNGYRIFAVDGSVIDLPDNPKMRERFGYSSCGTSTTICKGRAILVQDLLNYITIYGALDSFFISETKRMPEILDYIKDLNLYEKAVFVMDRGYPSYDLIQHLEKNGQKFLMRASASFFNSIQLFTEPDGYVTIQKKGKSYSVRVLNITLSSGITEKLITNLSADEFSYDELYELYGKRWGIETTIGHLKNSELIESFTGETVTAVLQDFNVGILLLTMSAIAYREQEDIIESKVKHKKYKYKPNRKQIICDIKTNFVKMIGSDFKAARIIREMYTFSRINGFIYADVGNRSRPRPDPKRHSTRKTHSKSAL